MTDWKKRYEYANKQKAFAWAKYYEAQQQELEDNTYIYNQYHQLMEDDKVRGVDNHLQSFIKDLYDKSKVVVECRICLEPISKDDLQTGRCGHNFHKNCMDEWKEVDKVHCPLCRKKF